MDHGRQTFSVSNILGKGPNDPKLNEVYKVESKQLGKGAFGVVRAATHKAKGEPVAVKSISKAKLVCKEDVKDVQAEVAIMNLVAGHPYVVTLKVRLTNAVSKPTRPSPDVRQRRLVPCNQHEAVEAVEA